MSRVNEQAVDSVYEFVDEDEAVKNGQRAEIMRVGFAPEPGRLEDDEGEEVPNQPGRHHQRCPDLQHPPSPRRARSEGWATWRTKTYYRMKLR